MGMGPMQLHSFSLNELRGVTHDFSSGYLLGECGYGTVHKGFIDAGMRSGLEPQPVAVKQLDVAGHQGHREWLAAGFNFRCRASLRINLNQTTSTTVLENSDDEELTIPQYLQFKEQLVEGR
ncbi:hypothetical protein ZWY2020_030074 [Hordeum vulgare]|nr:hypothetical protein ZWY2020_030074 [Hordeum vulgare]